MKTGSTKKELFSIIGHIESIKDDKGYNRHRFIPKSAKYLSHKLSEIPLKTELTCTFSQVKASRSQQQLAYHWVLLDLLAKYTGESKEELHDGIMRIKFGTKKIKLGKYEMEVRKSVSNKALFPKDDMVNLISFDLELCNFYEIKIPTAQELGYTSNDVVTKENIGELHKGLETPKGKPKF